VLAGPGRCKGSASEALGGVGSVDRRLKAGPPGAVGSSFERLAMALRAPLPGGTVTLLFTDIEGSTQHWEEQRAAITTNVPNVASVITSSKDMRPSKKARRSLACLDASRNCARRAECS
jgi:hypothetical protein